MSEILQEINMVFADLCFSFEINEVEANDHLLKNIEKFETILLEGGSYELFQA